MLFQTNVIISKLLLLVYLSLCTATPTDLSRLKIDVNGIKVLGAMCGTTHYSQFNIYDSVRIGIIRVRALLDYRASMERLVRYFPAGDEILPFEGPYFRQVIISSLSGDPYYENDYVVFTLQGQLVNVVKEILASGKLIYQDCRLEPVED